MAELSPASIAVDDALAACIQLQGEIIRARPLAAAALRAAADQVVPDAPDPAAIMGPVFVAEVKKQLKIRSAPLAIAAELRGTNPTNQED
jgi:hypothetical protein